MASLLFSGHKWAFQDDVYHSLIGGEAYFWLDVHFRTQPEFAAPFWKPVRIKSVFQSGFQIGAANFDKNKHHFENPILRSGPLSEFLGTDRSHLDRGFQISTVNSDWSNKNEHQLKNPQGAYLII